MKDLLKTIKDTYKGEPSKVFWEKVANALDSSKVFWDYNKDGSISVRQPNTGKLIEPFLKDKSNPKAQALVAYMSTTDKKLWDIKQIETIANGAAIIHTAGSGQSGSGQQGGFFLSALAGLAIPAIISAISGSGQGGAGFSPYKPKKQKNQYAYLK